jgi:ribosomal protein S18 acetylase RimI-like enzyme
VTTALRGGTAHLDGAAQVWAEATAARDGDPDVAPLSDSRPVIAAVLDQPGAVLAVALGERGQVTAFAVARPAGGPPATAEIEYAGVQPGRWGSGLGSSVLRFLCAELAAAGYQEAQLLCYLENHRAVRLYERLGWQAVGSPSPHRRTGKPEQRYRLPLVRRGR